MAADRARKSIIASQSIEARQTRAVAITCASMILHGTGDMERVFALADEFQDYIDGKCPEPKADKLR